MVRPISVLIVDDHPVVRQGLRALLAVQDGIEVAGETGDGATALALAAEREPDVILLDLKLPGLDGLAVLAELRERRCASRVLQPRPASPVPHIATRSSNPAAAPETRSRLLTATPGANAVNRRCGGR